jgi:hypothetical protein
VANLATKGLPVESDAARHAAIVEDAGASENRLPGLMHRFDFCWRS